MNVRVDHEGVWVSIQGKTEGATILLPASMTIAAIEHHLAEMREWLGA